jgi:hypothetical protein
MADPQQPPYPAPPPDSVSFTSFEGLKNTVTPERMKPTELWIGKNIDLDDAGQPRRRRGFRKVSDGKWHSLYSDGGGLRLGVKDGVLGIIYEDYSFSPILPNIGIEHLDYVRVGDVLYFSSLTSSGKFNVADKQVYPWGQQGGDGIWYSPVVHPTPTLGPVNGRLLGKVPMATQLTYWNGRIYLGCGRQVWATDLYLYDYVDKTRTFLTFESDVTMLASVSDGVYVGTTEAVYFLSGPSIQELKRVPLMNYGAIPGSSVAVPAELIKPQINQDPQSPIKNAVVFMTNTGIIAGFDGGVIYNLTQADFLFPLAASAATMFRRQDGINQFVAVLDSDGDPSDSARVGDYVDAEIRRFSGA